MTGFGISSVEPVS